MELILIKRCPGSDCDVEPRSYYESYTSTYLVKIQVIRPSDGTDKDRHLGKSQYLPLLTTLHSTEHNEQ